MQIKKVIFSNLGLKITALFLAVSVWVIISGKEYTLVEKPFDVNVEFFNVANTIDVSARPEKVRVSVKGTSKQLGEISPDDFKIKVDFKGITQATIMNILSEDVLEVPAGIAPDQVTIHPRMISLSVEQFISKEVPVKVFYRGKFKPGIKLIDRKQAPEKIIIYGYKSQIDSIDTVYVEKDIMLGEIDKSQKIKLSMKKSKEIIKFEGPDFVEIQFEIENLNKK